MIDLDTLLDRVEHLDLPADTKTRHLALLRAAQHDLARPAGGDARHGSVGSSTPPWVARRRSWLTAAAAAAGVVLVGGVTLLIPAQPAQQNTPTGHVGAATAPTSRPVTPQKVAGQPVKDGGQKTPAPPPQATITGLKITNSTVGGADLLTSPATAAKLAGLLTVSPAAAAAALHRLAVLAQSGSLQPRDPGFTAIAGQLHVTPQQLAAALDYLKKTG